MNILIILAHNRFTGINTWAYTLTKELSSRGYIVDYRVGTSKYNYEHMKCNGLIHNGIDMEEFSLEKWDPPNVKPKRALLLSRYGISHNMYYACNVLGIELEHSVFDTNIEEKIGLYDFVISHGIGAYEAMASGRPVLIYNSMYLDPTGKTLCDGWIKEETFRKILDRNSSGWSFRYDVSTIEKFKKMISKYDYTDGDKNRRLVQNMLSSKNMGDKFEKVFNGLK